MLCSGSPGPLAAIVMLCSNGSFTSFSFLPAEWYYQHNSQPLSFRKKEDNAAAEPVVYTPLHGVGLPWVQQVSYKRMLRHIWGQPDLPVQDSSSMRDRQHS